MVIVKTGLGAMAIGGLLTTTGLFFLVFLVGAGAKMVLFASEGTADTIVGTKVICPDDVTIVTLFKELVEDG